MEVAIDVNEDASSSQAPSTGVTPSHTSGKLTAQGDAERENGNRNAALSLYLKVVQSTAPTADKLVAVASAADLLCETLDEADEKAGHQDATVLQVAEQAEDVCRIWLKVLATEEHLLSSSTGVALPLPYLTSRVECLLTYAEVVEVQCRHGWASVSQHAKSVARAIAAARDVDDQTVMAKQSLVLAEIWYKATDADPAPTAADAAASSASSPPSPGSGAVAKGHQALDRTEALSRSLAWCHLSHRLARRLGDEGLQAQCDSLLGLIGLESLGLEAANSPDSDDEDEFDDDPGHVLLEVELGRLE